MQTSVFLKYFNLFFFYNKEHKKDLFLKNKTYDIFTTFACLPLKALGDEQVGEP
jgi:hypothetical protein